MQQLTGLDAMFAALDTGTTNGMLGGLVLHDPAPEGRRGPDAAFMRRRLAERLDHLPPLYRRRIPVPLGIDHAWLGRPARIDLDRHVRTTQLPAPGTHAQLAAEVSRIMSTSLAADGASSQRPLWDYTVIEGLADGSVAHLLRIHHLVVDGASMPAIWDALSDEPSTPLAPAGPAHPEPRFGTAEMAVREVVGSVTAPVRWTALQARLLRWVVGQVRAHGPLAPLTAPLRLLPGEVAGPVAQLLEGPLTERGVAPIAPYLPTVRPPRTPFNGRVSAQRTFAFADLPLAEVRDTGKAVGGTVNDVVLGVCAGALRRYLLARGIPAERPLVVCVPVSLRTGAEEQAWANHVHMIFAELPTHLEDPIERIRAAGAAVRRARGSFDALPTGLLREASRFLPTVALEWPVRAMVTLPDALSRGPWNVVVSNVRGPSRPSYVDGVRVKGYWPASFLSVGGGINITLQSYTDRLCFGFMAAPEQAGDLEPLVASMGQVLDETVSAVRHATARDAAPPAVRAPASAVAASTRKRTARARVRR